MKKLVLLMIIGIMLSISLLVGVSYAIWSNTHVQKGQGIVESGCFSTDFTEVNSISLSNSYPISDSKGMSATPYQFTITNTCSIDAKYEVNFEVLAGSTLSSNYVKLAIDNKKDILSNYESKTPTIEGALSSNNIASGWLKPEQSITYDLRLWIDEATTLEQGEGKSLSGKVVVVSVGDELNDSLISLLLEQYKEENEVGLVRDASNPNLYYYTGTNEEVANNFLWYGGHQWRVLEFDNSAKTITLITQQPLTAIQPASAVWESEEAYNSSYINTWLNDYFYNSLDSSVQATIQDSTFNIGIYTDVDEITTTKKVGLLDEEQYKRAGAEDSFLNIDDYFWMANRFDNSQTRIVSGLNILNVPVTHNYGVRNVIKINDIVIDSGSGSLTSSYSISNKLNNINNIQIGEYINVPYSGNDGACGSDKQCTFRVVSKDSDSIKLIFNGLLPFQSKYSESATISENSIIYTSLNNFANNISNNYRYTNNKVFYIGDYPSKTDYRSIKDETLSVSIGLPTVGELFCSNDIDMNFNKSFADKKTIENSDLYGNFWTMNRIFSPNIRVIGVSGGLGTEVMTNSGYVRPVIYLKNNLKITGGSGIAQNPYTLD